MKKAITLFALCFLMSLYANAQADPSRNRNDTNTLSHNKVNNGSHSSQDSAGNKMNRDSINDIKKMPPKKSTGTSINYMPAIKLKKCMPFNTSRLLV